ncbi:Pleckstrin homology domain-containing protein [Xylaria sp. FL0933]|nr:Pleckstrin homology domain-containing protein [Xylaria sp. FL0933]
MDPLSVASAVAGLLTAAHEVVKLLGPYLSASRKTPSVVAHVRDEAESTRTVLVGLQALVQGTPEEMPRGGSLVNVDQVVIILTSGVLLFAELEGTVRSLVAAPSLLRTEGQPATRALTSSQYRLPIWARIQWARQEESLESLLARLQGFKVSVTAVLTLLQCDTDRRAEQLQMELATNISVLLDSNADLSRRMMQLEEAFDCQTIRSRRRRDSASAQTVVQPEVEDRVAAVASSSEAGVMFISSGTEDPSPNAGADGSLASSCADTDASTSGFAFQSVFEFESDLEASRVYRRAKRDTMDFSFRTSIARTHAWSIWSGCSLADVSVLSVIALPLDLEDVTNSHHYMGYSQQQLFPVFPVTEEKQPQCDSNTSIMVQNSIFRDCLGIYYELIRIPGFQELLDKQWIEQGLDVPVIGNWDDSEYWQHHDLFRALKSIFRKDEAYRLLVESLGRNLAEEVRQYLSQSPCKAGNRATILFQALCDKLGLRIGIISWINDASFDDNVSFLKVLDCVSKVLDLFACDGTVCMDEGSLDAFVARVIASSPLPQSAYKHSLISFINSQWAFVKDILNLVSTLEQLEKSIQNAPLLGQDYPHLSSCFFSYYANSEIELLLTVERMLLAPFHRHYWASAVLQWSAKAETHWALTVTKEQCAKQGLRSYIEHIKAAATRFGDSQMIGDILKLATSCTELLSKPSQMFPRTADFFREIFAMLLGGFAGHETVSVAQKDDFSESQQLLECARRTVDTKILRQNELDRTLEDMVLRIEDLKGHKIELFGQLIDTGNFRITTSRRKRPQTYEVYLFEKILLCAIENKPVARTGRKSSGITGRAEAVNVAEQRPKLRLIGRVFLKDIINITRLSRNKPYEVLVSWRIPGDGNEWFSIYFESEQQMVQWERFLLELTPYYRTLSPAPSLVDLQRDTEIGQHGTVARGNPMVTATTSEAIPSVQLSPSSDIFQFPWLPVDPQTPQSPRVESTPSASASSRSSLTPPLRLQERPLLHPPSIGRAE